MKYFQSLKLSKNLKWDKKKRFIFLKSELFLGFSVFFICQHFWLVEYFWTKKNSFWFQHCDIFYFWTNPLPLLPTFQRDITSKLFPFWTFPIRWKSLKKRLLFLASSFPRSIENFAERRQSGDLYWSEKSSFFVYVSSVYPPGDSVVKAIFHNSSFHRKENLSRKNKSININSCGNENRKRLDLCSRTWRSDEDF